MNYQRILPARINALPSTAPHIQALHHRGARPGSILPSRFNPITPGQIASCDPATIAPTVTQLNLTPPIIAKTNRAPSLAKKLMVGAAAGAATMLTSALVLASDVATPLVTGGNKAFFAWGAIGLGLAYTTWRLWKQLKPGDYQSPQSQLNTASPTPKKIFKTLVVPAWLTMMAVGSAMRFAPAIDALLIPLTEKYLGVVLPNLTIPIVGMPLTLSWAVCSVLLGRAAIKMAVSSAVDLYRAYRFHRYGEQRNDITRPRLISSLITNKGHISWTVGAIFTVHLSEIYATQALSLLRNFLHNALFEPNALTGAAVLGAVFGLVGLARHFIVGRKELKVGQPLEKHPWVKTAALAAGSAFLVGAGVSLGGPALAAANLLVFAAVLGFYHNFIHSSRSQEGGLHQKDKVFPVFDLQSLWENVRGPWGAARTIFKPGVDMVDPLVSSYIMVMLTEGSNWVLNALSGCFSAADYSKAIQMITKLLNPAAEKMRAILKTGYNQVKSAATAEAARDAFADSLEATARFLEERATGDLKTVSGLGFLKDGMFATGLPGIDNKRGDQDLRVHGEHLRFAARIYEETARRIRSQDISQVDLASYKATLATRLNALYCRAFPHSDTTPVRFYTNILPDGYNAKQFAVDFCQQVMADFVGAFDVAIIAPNGQLKLWLVPMKVVKDFKEDYRDVLAVESRDAEGEDLRFGWYERADHDIVNTTLSDIAYIDNTDHFRRHGHDISKYPTAEVLTPPTLANDEYYDVVYRDGTRLRVFGDGRDELISGTLEGKAPLLILPGTKRHEYTAANTAEVLNGTPIDSTLYDSLQKGDIPHPWGGSLIKDSNIACRWRFMYPTEYTSVSDADQMDINVTNLRLFHVRANPHLRIMFRRPRVETVPYSPDMVESKNDSLLEAGVAVVWMMMKVKLADGRELYFPLNMNKENERTFGGDLWKYIDQTKPLQIVKKETGYFLKISYREEAKKDPDFRNAVGIETNTNGTLPVMKGGKYNNRESISEVPMPIEMIGLADQISTASIDPIRYGDVGGPVPVMDYFFIRHNENGDVTDQSRQKTLPRRLAQQIIAGTYSLLSQKEMDHAALVDKTIEPGDLPYTDDNGLVHMNMTREEYAQLIAWLPNYHGGRQAMLRQGEMTMEVGEFVALCNSAYEQFSYRRFMPDDRYRTFWEAAEVKL
ncbi:MAG: hypothetical protein KKF06_08565 [Candidatus Margulisbacteria bacterium]|nr:hypothetical protein [Candidatus Margulisiibacteriota bacterium]